MPVSLTVVIAALCLAFLGLGIAGAAILGAYVLAKVALPLIVDLKAQHIYQLGLERLPALEAPTTKRKASRQRTPASLDEDLPFGEWPAEARARIAMARALEQTSREFDD